MTLEELEELKQSEWYTQKPEIIKQAIDILPPNQLYKFKDSGKQCYIVSFEEPESGKLEDVTCTVQKTGVGGVLADMGMSKLDTNKVFGLKPEDLEVWSN